VDARRVRRYAIDDDDILPELPSVEEGRRIARISRLMRKGSSLDEENEKRWSVDGGDYCIYCLVEGGKHVRYIGITNCSPEQRLRQHMGDCGRGKNAYKENWIRSCRDRGAAVTIHVLRAGLPAARAGMLEVELIRFFRKAFRLVNTHAGGATGYAGLSEESREKHRINTEKGIMAAIERELQAEDVARGYCIIDDDYWDRA
jgi:hypothetical protein